MKTFKLLFAALILATGFNSFAQTGEIEGKITADDTKEVLPGTYVYVVSGATKITALADENGKYKLKGLNPGYYDIAYEMIGYKKIIIEQIKVDKNDITFSDVELPFSNTLGIYEFEEERYTFKIPLIDKDNPALQKLDGKDLAGTAYAKDIKTGITTMVPGITMVPGSSTQISVRGARPIETAYYVDGVKSTDGNLNVPGISVMTVQVYTSGVPAQYGDVTGGVVAVETKGYFDLLNNK